MDERKDRDARESNEFDVGDPAGGLEVDRSGTTTDGDFGSSRGGFGYGARDFHRQAGRAYAGNPGHRVHSSYDEPPASGDSVHPSEVSHGTRGGFGRDLDVAGPESGSGGRDDRDQT